MTKWRNGEMEEPCRSRGEMEESCGSRGGGIKKYTAMESRQQRDLLSGS